MIIFVPFWEHMLAKNISKNCVFLPYFDIFGEIQLVSEDRHLVDFVTLDIFKLYMSNKAIDLYKNCSKFKFKCFVHQIVPNGMMRVE